MMSTRTVRVSKRTHDELQKLSQQIGESMQAVVEQAVEELRRKRFLEQTHKTYMEVRNDPSAWEDTVGERTA